MNTMRKTSNIQVVEKMATIIIVIYNEILQAFVSLDKQGFR